MQRRKIRKAVIPAAGFGTRMLPATKSIPKELLTIVDRPVLDYIVSEAFDSGIEHVVIVTGRMKAAIEDHFDHAFELDVSLRRNGKHAIADKLSSRTPGVGAISFVRQQEARGLGHAAGDGADAGLGYQFHRHQAVRVDLLDVEDEHSVFGNAASACVAITQMRAGSRATPSRPTHHNPALRYVGTRASVSQTRSRALGAFSNPSTL